MEKVISYTQQKEVRLKGMVTYCIGTDYKPYYLRKDRKKDISDGTTRKNA